MDARVEAIQAAVPAAVRAVCRELAGAGHAAYAVGGAVRDALLGRPIGDWDVATSARPEAVLALFRRTIPTGLQHGTVTVLVGKGSARTAVEVTTFRGEGDYSDGRHPDRVTFGVTLDEDLSRRDFVINAIAFDPVAGVLYDPLGGIGDLERRTLRAVGDPAARFAEDGLRAMRAVRFAATLEFALDPATEAAIAGALPVLRRVSHERVRDEIDKLLGARRPGVGLEIAARTGILATVLPEIADPSPGGRIGRVDAAPREVRWAALLGGLGPAVADSVARRLRLKNSERIDVVRLIAQLPPAPPEVDDVTLRRKVGTIGRDRVDALAGLWSAWGAEPEVVARLVAAGRSRAPVTAAELEVGGGDIMRILGIGAGPQVGRILHELMEHVLHHPESNQPAVLEQLIRDLAADR